MTIKERSFTTAKTILLAVVTFGILLTGNVTAQEEKEEPSEAAESSEAAEPSEAAELSEADSNSPSSTFRHAINFCPGGIAFGIIAANYEYLFNPSHGMVIRFDYEGIPSTYTDASIESSGWAIILNYRYHFSGELESLYLGAFGRYREYSGSGILDGTAFDFKRPDVTLGLNIGHRWVWNSGINLNVAFGYGYNTSSREANPSTPDIEAMLDQYEDEYDFMGPFLGEISIGYAF